MRVVVATVGKFHILDLAREMHHLGWLEAVFTGYPHFKLRNEGVPTDRIRSFPWLQGLYMTRGRLGLNSPRFERELAWCSHQTFDAYTAARLPRCDVFLALSGDGLKAGTKAQKAGAIYICDRGSSHIRFQERILREEYALHNIPFLGIDPRKMAKEEAEYAQADMITTPSGFVRNSFIAEGISEKKTALVPYGVNLARFCPVGTPDKDRFDVLFVGAGSVRKGIPYLLEAFSRLRHPNKHLTMVGIISPEVKPFIERYSRTLSIRCTGHIPQVELKEIMSRSHVSVLASIEEGLALVMAQMLACGCPVIATTNTGAMDLYQDGKEGFIVPIRDPQIIADRLQQLADTPSLRESMSAAALERVQGLGGWDAYGRSMAALFSTLVKPGNK